VHKDTTVDFDAYLKNLDVKPYDMVAEYKIGRALMCGTSQQIIDVLSNLEATDIYDKAIQVIYNTVKEEYEKGDTRQGLSHYAYIYNTYRDRFTADGFKLNVYNGDEVGRVSDFGNIKLRPDEEETKVCINMVKSKKAMRDLMNNLWFAIDMCKHVDNGVEKAYDFLRENVAEHDTTFTKDDGKVSKLDFAEGMLNHVYECNDPEARAKNTINMPWRKFQSAIGGFRAEQLVIISARSGQGKSAFSLNVGIEAGVTQKIPTLYINSELSNDDMVERYLSYTCYLDSRKIREGGYRDERTETKLNDMVRANVQKAQEAYFKSGLLFEKIPDLQISNVEKAINRDCLERGTRLVIVDYLGRMDITKTAGVRDLQEWQIMRLAANRLKTLAQKYHVCVIMVCQLTDEGTLQGSKAIKNEADMWLSINRLREDDDKFEGKTLKEIFPYNTFINIEKARGVSDTGAIAFRYEGAMMRFCDTPKAIAKMIKSNKEYGDAYKNDLLDAGEYSKLCEMVAWKLD
jgi:replicative DNA helicase